jgi:3',5'-cyclic-AMP phosphodiesterase
MPEIFYQPMDRRRFLDQSGRAIAACAMAAAFGARAAALPSAKPFHVALLADTHIAADPGETYRGFLPYANLAAVVPQVAEAEPEGVIIDGDVARLAGEVGDYERIKELLIPLADRMPIYFALGNHDHRANFRNTFPPASGGLQEIPGKHVLVIERPGVRLILLDSLLYVDRVAGLLGQAQREWLGRYLTSVDDRATVFFVHHTLGDGDSDLLDAERFFRIIQPFRKVKAVFYGHSHRYSMEVDRGLHLVNLPAVGYNFRDQEPVGWVDARFTEEGVALTLRALAGNRAQDGATRSLAWRS